LTHKTIKIINNTKRYNKNNRWIKQQEPTSKISTFVNNIMKLKIVLTVTEFDPTEGSPR